MLNLSSVDAAAIAFTAALGASLAGFPLLFDALRRRGPGKEFGAPAHVPAAPLYLGHPSIHE